MHVNAHAGGPLFSWSNSSFSGLSFRIDSNWFIPVLKARVYHGSSPGPNYSRHGKL